MVGAGTSCRPFLIDHREQGAEISQTTRIWVPLICIAPVREQSLGATDAPELRETNQSRRRPNEIPEIPKSPLETAPQNPRKETRLTRLRSPAPQKPAERGACGRRQRNLRNCRMPGWPQRIRTQRRALGAWYSIENAGRVEAQNRLDFSNAVRIAVFMGRPRSCS